MPGNVRGSVIREEQRYGGVRLQLTAVLGDARIPIQIDIGFGDAITPKPTKVSYPTMLEQPAPRLLAYPKETVVAEKYEAMVSLGIANSRMKDFYDLWVLARDFEFNGATLIRAIRATFGRRKTDLPSAPPLALTEEFAKDQSKQMQWSAFMRRSRLIVDVPHFGQVLVMLQAFLWPPTESLVGQKRFGRRWKPGGPWK
jgi:hypothetical protein